MEVTPSCTVVSQDEKSLRLFNFCGDVFSFQFTHSISNERQSQRGSELKFSRMSFQRDTNNFLIKNEGTALFSKSSSTDVDIVDCASTVDVNNGLTIPCVLLKQYKKKGASFKYILLMLSHQNSLNPHMEFKLPYEIKDNVMFLQGPTVLWSHEGLVYYTSLQAGGVRQVPVQLSSVSFIGELPEVKRKIMILGSEISAKERLSDQQENIWGQRSLGYFLEDGKAFDGAWILPHAYSSVVKCVLLIHAKEDNDQLRSTAVAATSKNQLVWFENGVPKDVCQLPFEEPQNIQMVNAGRNGCLFAISFKHGNVCAVWKESFQVASCWQGVCSLLVDDFVGCGTDQVLLLFESHHPPGATLTNFMITDLGDMIYTSRLEDSEQPDPAEAVQENYLLTVQALESRLQSGTASIQDLQRDLEEKERVIVQSVQALTDLISGRKHALPRADQEGLVSMWDEDKEEEDSEEEMLMMPAAPPSLVEKVWQRVIEDQLVVGVQLTADAASSVESVSVSFLAEAGQGPVPAVVQTRSRSFQLGQPPLPTPTPLSHPEPAAKRKKCDHTSGTRTDSAQRLTVTAVTKLSPLLASAHLKCRVTLHSVHLDDAATPWRTRGPVATQCGYVYVDAQDVAKGKFSPRLLNDCALTTADATEDLLSLLAVSDTWSFQISCSDHTLSDVSQWLLGPMQCERVAVSPDYFLSKPVRSSAVILCKWQKRTPFQGELLIHSSSWHRLLQFLDCMCRILPPSYQIQPLRKGGVEGLTQTLASALEKEALALREGVSSLLSLGSGEGQEGEGGVGVTPDPAPVASADELQRRRAEWERDGERSRRRLSPLVEVEHYRRLTASLSQVQLEGDMAAHSLWEAQSVPPASHLQSFLLATPNI
ncbi:Fanconi anemia group B protein [Megalops cyprinoides]|uniref:Fanconi anemia group B protein n=1 Tax=Megalops cyprinoides TaxID=118141 RepID=UPI0018650757|nr:Fanconi anemia group B protein [Megalops cyprinoides]